MFLHVLTCSNIMNIIPNLYHVVIDKCTFIFTLQNFIPKKYFWALLHCPNVFHLYFTEQITLHLLIIFLIVSL